MSASARWTPFETWRLAGHTIVTAGCDALAEAMVSDCLKARRAPPWPRLVFDVNGQGVSMRDSHRGYRAAVDSADVVHADGMFLVFLSRFLPGIPIAERSATTDLIHTCARRAEAAGLTFYLLGAEQSVVEGSVRELIRRYPKLRIVGFRNGFFSADEEAGVIEEINRLQPDVLWVGMGKPREQLFATRWRARLECGWLVTCGGCFNYLTGAYPRAPHWMQRAGLEWLFRAKTSRALFWRYLTTNPHALWVTLRDWVRPT